MKKLFLSFTIIILISGFTHATDFSLELKGSYFSPSEEAFKDIYGGGFTFGGELTAVIWNNLQVWVEGSYYSGEGQLTYTEEETSLRIVPFGGGLKYRLPVGKFNIYGGFGMSYYQYKETNVLGEVSKGGIGYVGKIGVVIKVTKNLFFDLFGEYTYCKMTPAEFTINIGGISAGIGFGYEFKKKD